jgi:acyl-CoA thioesterase
MMDTKVMGAIFKAIEKEAFAKTYGLKLHDLDTGYSVMEMLYDSERINNRFERAHGGAIFALIDESFQTACQTHGTIAIALNVNVTYISSPSQKTFLRAVAIEISKTRKTANYDIRLTDPDNQLIGTCMALPTGRGNRFGLYRGR